MLPPPPKKKIKSSNCRHQILFTAIICKASCIRCKSAKHEHHQLTLSMTLHIRSLFYTSDYGIIYLSSSLPPAYSLSVREIWHCKNDEAWCRMFDTQVRRRLWMLLAGRGLYSSARVHARVHCVRHGSLPDGNPAVPFSGHLQLLPGVGRPACGRVSRRGTVPVYIVRRRPIPPPRRWSASVTSKNRIATLIRSGRSA